MRPPRFILLLLCFILIPIFLTSLSFLFVSPEAGEAPDSPSRSTNRFKTWFSFHAPSSLFPPSAIISLTDDNSTFFLARPAAFGPLLPKEGLSGALWIGSGFSDETISQGGSSIRTEGELGCSDVPGWEDAEQDQKKKLREGLHRDEKFAAVDMKVDREDADTPALHEKRSAKDVPERQADGKSSPGAVDGTDNHLHHPLAESPQDEGSINGDSTKATAATHADIQSLQETAEITGKVVLLSRGGCGFLEKVKWVQRRGGAALIVGDDTRGGSLVTMYARGDTSNVTIPALFTSYTTAHLLSSLIPPETGSDDVNLGKPQQSAQSTAKQGKKAKPSTTEKATSKPTATPYPTDYSKPGLFRSALSLFSFSKAGSGLRALQEDSRRPPSSGNLDWVRFDPFNDDESSIPSKSQPSTAKGKQKTNPPPVSNSPLSDPPESDDFVIGVQDWRDPDLVAAPKTASKSASTTSTAPSNSKTATPAKGSHSEPNGPKGGIITPGSGEYVDPDKQSKGKPDPRYQDTSRGAQAGSQQEAQKHKIHWWSELLSGSDSDKEEGEDDWRPPSDNDPHFKDTTRVKPAVATAKAGEPEVEPTEHEGLWVTLTPTNMSSSPFFDTLLVLVVSPLVTLTVVYALLLLRSRIRRRRWRAPKAVVERLPIRTYHTMSPRSSTPSPTSSATASSSPPSSRSRSPHSRPRSQTVSGSINATSPQMDHGSDRSSHSAEKPASPKTFSRRKYTGRQVECVVCLEEYIDGQSQIMSLPCGHEFHADCITPWLTTRRRTCPICKGDVVRCMDRPSNSRTLNRDEVSTDDLQSRIAETRNESPSAAVPIQGSSGEDMDSDLERGDSSRVPLLGDQSQQSNWRNLASLSLSAWSGDSMWHQPRHSRPDRNR